MGNGCVNNVFNGKYHVKFTCLCEIGSMNCGHEMDQQIGHLMGKKKDGL